MKSKYMLLSVFGAICVAGYGGYRAGMQKQMTLPARTAVPAAGKTVLYWQDPMVPGQRFDKPGKSPYMDMPLVPVYADSGEDKGKVAIDSRIGQNLGIRTAEVGRGNLESSIETVGNVAYDERELVVLQARATGYVEKLDVRATLDPVRKGQALAELYFPDWIAAQEDFLTAKRLAAREGSAGQELIEAARERMRLAGMTDAQIGHVEFAGKVEARQVIVSPMDGVVSELGIREGATVASGSLLFRMNGLGRVWINAAVPEGYSERVRTGDPVRVRTVAGLALNGKVGAVLPDVDPVTRTLKARIEMINPGRKLVPGMFVTVEFSPEVLRDVLLVPSEAVIRTGMRTVAIVSQGDGKFVPVEISTGRESNGQTEILGGLSEGQKVVVSGQFLIDSEASLKGTELRMAPRQAAAPVTHHGHGRMEAIGRDEITISHGAIPSLQWPAMTMSFRVPRGGLPQGIKTGDIVDFEIRVASDGEYEIVSIAPGARP